MIALLDSVVKKGLAIIDETGKVIDSISLVQKEIPEPGAVIGIY